MSPLLQIFVLYGLFIFMSGWVFWLIRTHEPLLILLTTIALSWGTLSLVMLFVGMLGIPIQVLFVAPVILVLALVGIALIWSNPLRVFKTLNGLRPKSVSRLELFAIIVILLIAGLILFNAIYWPLGVGDATVIYGWFGKQIAQSGQLPRGNLYEAYPMFLPLSYAYIFQLSGTVNEYMAWLIPAAFSVGVIGVAYLLGKELFNRSTGLLAALLIVLAPMITHWGSTGYVDLPTSFFYGLSALFLFRWNRTRSWQDALLTGLMGGLAAWMKISGLLVVIPIGLWVGYLLVKKFAARNSAHAENLKIRDIALMVGGFGVVAGPWYLRNVLINGVLIPSTAWIDKTQHTPLSLLPYLADSRYFPIGILLTLGLFYVLWSGLARRDTMSLFLLAFYVPFFAIWWLLFSYDDRFLLVLTPIIGVMSANALQEIFIRFASRLPLAPRLKNAVSAIIVLAVVLLAIPAISAAVDHKVELLHNPLMTDLEKHEVRVGSSYDMALYMINNLPAGTRIWTQELLLPYYADGMQIIVGPVPTIQSQLAGYDYLLLLPGETLPTWFSNTTPTHTESGYRLYKVG